MRCTFSDISPILGATARRRRWGLTPSDEEVRPLEVFCEVDLDGVQVRDVERLEAHAVLGDRELETALEVVLVIDARELADERLLVGARDVVDPDRLADAAARRSWRAP